MSDWIKVSDREPEMNAPIIAWLPNLGSDGGLILAGRLELLDLGDGDGAEKIFMPQSNDWGDWYQWRLVTHWMPWPEAPEDVSA